MRDFIWVAGVALRVVWIVLALLIGLAVPMAASMTLATPAGFTILCGSVVVAFPLAGLTYLWSLHAEKQPFLRWLGMSVYGWVIAIAFFLITFKLMTNLLSASRAAVTLAIWAAIIVLVPFYAYVAATNVARITAASPPPPAVVKRPLFWLVLIVCAAIIQSLVWYRQRDSLLISAAEKGAERRAAILLRIGANPNGTSNKTPLAPAAARGNVAIVRGLLTAGADVNHADAWGRTALFGAAQGGHIEVCRLLLAAGAKANVVAQGHSTPLLCAVESGSLSVVQMILQSGVAVDEPGVTGWTPFMTAIASEHFEIAQALAHAGANVNATDWKGQTVLQWARKQSKDDVVAFLRATYPDAR